MMIDVFLTLLNAAIVAGAILIVVGIIRCISRGGCWK